MKNYNLILSEEEVHYLLEEQLVDKFNKMVSWKSIKPESKLFDYDIRVLNGLIAKLEVLDHD